MDTMTLGIIGTAGRGTDAAQLTASHWRMMVCIGQTVACTLGATRLVSGGSAWADAVAVQLYIDGHVDGLTLHLPTSFKTYTTGDAAHFVATGPGARLNELHEAHSRAVGFRTLREIERAIAKGAQVQVHPAGFHARNVAVAKDCGSLLAFTFSGGPEPKPGGTRETWDLFRAEADAMFRHAHEHYQESPCGCSCNVPGPVHAYHFDLTARLLHRHVYEDPTTTQWREDVAREREIREAIEAGRPAAPQPQTEQERKHRLL